VTVLLRQLTVGLRELCWNNFGNFEAIQYSRIILRIIGGIKGIMKNIIFQIRVIGWWRTVTNQGTEPRTDSDKEMS